MSVELWNFILLLLTVLLPVVAAMLATQLYSLLAVVTKMKQHHLNNHQQYALDEAITVAVRAAEQSGLKKDIIVSAYGKKQEALAAVQHYLDTHGLKGWDVQTLDTMIEAAVYSEFNKSKSHKTTDAPIAPLALIAPVVLGTVASTAAQTVSVHSDTVVDIPPSTE